MASPEKVSAAERLCSRTQSLSATSRLLPFLDSDFISPGCVRFHPQYSATTESWVPHTFLAPPHCLRACLEILAGAALEKDMATHSSVLGLPWWLGRSRIHLGSMPGLGRSLKSRARLSDFAFTFHFHALEKEMATHSSDFTWRIPGTGSLVGCRLRGRAEPDTTEATYQQQGRSHSYTLDAETGSSHWGRSSSSTSTWLPGGHTRARGRGHRPSKPDQPLRSALVINAGMQGQMPQPTLHRRYFFPQVPPPWWDETPRLPTLHTPEIFPAVWVWVGGRV